MAVFQRFFSDRDPTTMFETKAEADAHDRKLEAIEDLSVLLEQSATAAKLKVDEDGLYKMA